MPSPRMLALVLDRQLYGESLAAQVDYLRRAFDPDSVRRAPAYIALVRPFRTSVTEAALRHHVASVCDTWDPFTVQLVGIGASYEDREMFVQVGRGAGELVDLHLALTTGILAEARAPYFPHVTVYRAGDQESFARAFRPLRARPLEGRFLAGRVTLLEQAEEVWRPVQDFEFRPEPAL